MGRITSDCINVNIVRYLSQPADNKVAHEKFWRESRAKKNAEHNSRTKFMGASLCANQNESVAADTLNFGTANPKIDHMMTKETVRERVTAKVNTI